MRLPSALHASCLIVFFLAVEFADAMTTQSQRMLWDRNSILSHLIALAKQYAQELQANLDAENNHWSEVKAQTLQKNYVESTSMKEHWDKQDYNLKEYCEMNQELCDEKRSQLQAKRVTNISTLVDGVRNERNVQTEDRVVSLAHLKENAQVYMRKIEDLIKYLESIKYEVNGQSTEEAEYGIKEQMENVKSDETQINELIVESHPKLATTPMCFLIDDVSIPSGLSIGEQEEKITKSVELSLELSFMELKHEIEVVGSLLVTKKFIEKDDGYVNTKTQAGGSMVAGNEATVLQEVATENEVKTQTTNEDEDDDDRRLRGRNLSSRNLSRRRGMLLITVEVGYTVNDVTDVATSDVYGRRRSLLDINLFNAVGEYAPTVFDANGAVKTTDSTTVSVIDCSDPMFV